MPKFLLVILLSAFTTVLYAQTWEIGAGIGAAGYMGDLNQHNPLQVSGAQVNGFVKRNFNGYLSLRASLYYGKIAAADSNSSNLYQQNRNLSFANKLIETSLIGEFNFMHYIPDAGKNRFTPFIYAGFGITPHAPYTKAGNNTVWLRGLRTEGQEEKYPGYVMVIPYGAGVKYNISGKFNLIGDVGYRYAFTDYLDDVSGYYPDPALANTYARRFSDRSPGQTAIPGSQRGDLRKRDTYMFFSISLSYTFVTQKCYFESRR